MSTAKLQPLNTNANEQERRREQGPQLSQAQRRSIWSFFRGRSHRLFLTYALFNVENLLRLAQPLVLGWAINDLLNSSYAGLVWFVGQHIAHLIVGTIRQMYDTRTFTSIYSNLATELVVDQRSQDVDVSRVAARSTLSREYVEFFERYVPMMIRAGYSVVGALLMLSFYDGMLIPICLALLIPAIFINRWYAKRTLRLSKNLHDELENEVDVIGPGLRTQVRTHYDSVAGWRIKLSDSEAVNFGLMELFVLSVLIVALIRICGAPTTAAGDIFAVFRYLMMVIMGLDTVPRLVQQVSRLRDINRRLGS